MDIFSETPVQAIFDLSAPSTDTLQINIYEPAFGHIAELLEREPPKITYATTGERDINYDPPTSKEWGVKDILILADDPRPGWKALGCPLGIFADHDQFTHEEGMVVSNSLHLVLSRLGSLEVEGDPKLLQLTGNISLYLGARHAILGCYLLPGFTAWLKKHPGERFPDIADKMTKAFCWGEIDVGAFSSNSVYTNNDGKPIITCPGDACDFAVYPDCMTIDDAWEMSCHNVDTTPQQINLLYGLACLHDLARVEGD